MWVRTLVEGGQSAEDVAGDLVAWLGGARRSRALALYDVRLPGPVGDAVAGSIRAARDRGVQVRIAFNQDERSEEPRPFETPPPRTEPTLLEQLGVALAPIPGWRDLMHHKYVVRDGAAVWTGSTNWTLEPWGRGGPARPTGPWTRGSGRRTWWSRSTRPSSPPPTRATSRSSGSAATSATRATSTHRPRTRARGSARAAAPSPRTASPSASGPRGGACASPPPC